MDYMKGITIGGKHTFRDLGLILVDGSENIGLPEVQTYSVEVPGRDGLIDLTEAMTGGVAYKNRECSWQFADGREYGERTDALVGLANMLHGRKLDFVLDDRPDYVCTGRFTAKVEQNRRGFTLLNLTADCEPYFSKGLQTLRVNAAGGIVVSLKSGRKPVCPTFEFMSETIVSSGDAYARMQAGAYKINDLWLHEGANEVYINSYLGDGNVAISTYEAAVISDYASHRVSELMWEGIRKAALAIEDWQQDSVRSHSKEIIGETEFAVDTDSEEYAVYIQYDWSDL